MKRWCPCLACCTTLLHGAAFFPELGKKNYRASATINPSFSDTLVEFRPVLVHMMFSLLFLRAQLLRPALLILYEDGD